MLSWKDSNGGGGNDDDFINARNGTGDRYSTADEVVREALRLLEERDRFLEEHQLIESIEEFEAIAKQLADEFEACVKPDVPLLSDYAVSRAGIYEKHP